MPAAARPLAVALPEAVATAVIEFITGDLLRFPRRVGHELRCELAGTWSARRGSYRVLYEIDDGTDRDDLVAGEVRVLSVEHRRDAYRHR